MRMTAPVFSAAVAALMVVSIASVARSDEVLEASPGHYLHIVVTIKSSPHHNGAVHYTQISIGFKRMVLGKDGKAQLIEGLNPKVEHLLNKDLEITSDTKKPAVKDGAIELTFKGFEGHKLVLVITGQRLKCDDADWLLPQD